MKFTVTMKDPHGVLDCITEAVTEEVEKIKGLSEDEREALIEQRTDEVKDTMKKWFEHSEYLRVEIDTDAVTCVVQAAR